MGMGMPSRGEMGCKRAVERLLGPEQAQSGPAEVGCARDKPDKTKTVTQGCRQVDAPRSGTIMGCEEKTSTKLEGATEAASARARLQPAQCGPKLPSMLTNSQGRIGKHNNH